MKNTPVGIEEFLKDVTPFFYRRRVTYVDVGAFKGEEFEKLLESSLNLGEAHLVEPNPKSIKLARDRTTPLLKGDAIKSVNFYNVALGKKPGRVRMHAAKDMTKVISEEFERVSAPAEDDNTFEVECRTLDEMSELFTEKHVSILKIDVEGFEAEVLEGAHQLLSRQGADCIYIEAGMNPLGQQQCYYRRIEDILTGHGYGLFRIYEQKNEWLDDSPLLRRVNLAFMSGKFSQGHPYRLTRELYQSNEQNTQLKADLQAALARADSMDREIRAFRAEGEAAAAEARRFDAERQSVHAERDAADRRAAELDTVAVDLKARVDGLRAELDGAREERVATEARASAVEAAFAELKTHSEGLAAAAEAADHALALARATLADAQRRLDELTTQMVDLRERDGLLIAEKARLEDVIARSAETRAELKAAADRLAEENAALETRLARSEGEATRASLAAESAETRVRRLADEFEEQGAALSKLTEQAASEERRLLSKIDAHRVEEQVHRRDMTDVFAAIRELHQREVRAWKSASNAQAKLARIRGNPAFRLARVVRGQMGSLSGWARMPASLWHEWGRLRSDSDTPSQVPAQVGFTSTVTFESGKSSLTMPLTNRPQRVSMNVAEEPTTLYASARSNRGAAAVTVQLVLAAEDGLTNVVKIGGIALKPADVSMSTLRRRVRILAARPVPLIEVAGSGPNVEIVLSRAQGDFSILTLDMEAPNDAADAAVPAWPPAQPAPFPAETEPTLSDTDARPWARQSTLLASGPEALVVEAPLPEPPLRAQAAIDLEKKLWGGFAQYALPALERLKVDVQEPVLERETAAWYLSRWYYVHEDHHQALANIDEARRINNKPQSRFMLAQAQSLLAVGRLDEADSVLERGARIMKKPDYRLLRTTSIRLRALRDGRTAKEADAAQLEALNELLARGGLAPIELRRPDLPLSLANIRAGAQAVHLDQALKVSIIMPTFNAESSIEWVIQSLLEQTWRNIELVVVDDVSTDDTVAIVARIAARDGRVRLLRNEQNIGAYRTRNTGARAATGDLLTVHDSDDWSHPQKVERHVVALLEHPEVVAVVSHWVRVTEQLEVIGSWIPKGTLYDVNFSSLMFRRSLGDEIGLWDDVLISGDAEFYSRLQTIYGKAAVLKLAPLELLAFSLTRPDSLTRSKATHLRTLFFGLRWNYRDAYLFWHARLPEGKAQLPFDASSTRRRFPVPVGNRTDRLATHDYDVVVISDLAMRGGAFVSTLNYMVAAARSGRRVAIFHWRKYSLSSSAPLQPRVYEACLAHGIDIISSSDVIECDVLLIGYPAILSHQIDPIPKITPRNLLVIINQFASRLVTGEDVQYDPAEVRQRLVANFGTEGTWIPISSWVARLMKADTRYPEPYDLPWSPMVDVDTWCTFPLRWRGAAREKPVVGRHGRDTYTKWPSSTAALQAAYGVGLDWDVRFLGGADHAIDMLGGKPANWQVVPFDAITAPEFLQDLDFYIHFPHEQYIEEFGRAIAEAMAVGIPVVLPPQFQQTFGTAATYADPDQVAHAVSALWKSREKYLERAAAGRRFVIENCDSRAFDERLRRVLGPREAEAPPPSRPAASEGSEAALEVAATVLEQV